MSSRARDNRLDNRRTGQYWESVAGDYLERQGLLVLLRGYYCRLGELDLVCRDDTTLVIVEVRARRSSTYACAQASVDRRKQHKIVLATRHLLMTHPEWAENPVRFDVVAIEAIEMPQPEIHWLRNAFDTNG